MFFIKGEVSSIVPGQEGDKRRLKLELRVLADVNMLGLPTAGKSTFISTVSAARPKIADYPFTTLHPQLGVVSVSRYRGFVVDVAPIDQSDSVESYKTISEELFKYNPA